MGELRELAERCEAATGPAFVLDEAIAKLIHELDGRMWSGLSRPYTASLDAAMTISPVTRQVDVLLDAISACQGDEDGWLRDLPRFVCAAALRAREEYRG
jgi:hypothetical protein